MIERELKLLDVNSEKSVLVMLAAYNGSKYIKEQVDSILNQKNVQVHVLVRDDLSKDDTVELLEEFYGDDNRVEVIRAKKNLGCAQSFLTMAMNADHDYDYYAFSDQDDFWKEDRLTRAISAIEKEGQQYRSVLYCSNREEVDENKHFLYYNVPIENNDRFKKLDYLLYVRNIAPGNTMVFSEPFLDHLKAAKEIDLPSGFYHDYWVHIVAASLKDTSVIYDMSYGGVQRRLTGSNLAGFNREKGRGLKARFKQFSNYDSGSLRFIANEVITRYQGRIDEQSLELLKLFASANSLKSRILLLTRSKNVKYDSIKGRLFGLYKLLLGKI